MDKAQVFFVDSVTSVHELATAAGTIAMPVPGERKTWAINEHRAIVAGKHVPKGQVIVMDAPPPFAVVDPCLALMREMEDDTKARFRQVVRALVEQQESDRAS